MIIFFKTRQNTVIAVESADNHNDNDIKKFSWLFGDAKKIEEKVLKGFFFGPRREMITPWSTNAVEITQNMGIRGVQPGRD